MRTLTLLQASVVSLSLAAATAPAPTQSLATDIADHYVRSFASESTQEGMQPKGQLRGTAVHLEEKKKREVVLNDIFAVSKVDKKRTSAKAPVLNRYAWNDLKLFCGTTSTPQHHLVHQLNRTTTLLGEGALATLLATPTHNMTELQQRQAMLKAFLSSTEEVKSIKEALAEYHQGETSLLSLWTASDPLYTDEYQQYMNKYFYSKTKAATNKSAFWLELKKRFFRDFWSIQAKFFFKEYDSPC